MKGLGATVTVPAKTPCPAGYNTTGLILPDGSIQCVNTANPTIGNTGIPLPSLASTNTGSWLITIAVFAVPVVLIIWALGDRR